MNRRGFLRSMLRAGVAAAVLPPATTYLRAAWKQSRIVAPVGFWMQTERAARCVDQSYESFITNCRIIAPTAAELDTLFRTPGIDMERLDVPPVFDRYLSEEIRLETLRRPPVHLFDLLQGS